MKKRYVASPYTYGTFNNPTSWGIWNTESKSWTTFMPCRRKKDAEEVAKSWNENLAWMAPAERAET